MANLDQPIPPGCPWSGMQESFGQPNVKWCEERLCAWVNEPANAWSNLAYLAVALWCFARARSTGSRTWAHFGWTLTLVGAMSFVYHATNNFGTQVLDFVGMYVFAFLLVALNLFRAGWLSRSRVAPLQAGLAVLFTLLVPVMKAVHFPYQAVVLVAVFVIIGTEVVIARRPGPRASYRDFGLGLVFLAAGAAFSASDVTGAFCSPTNHWVQGHAIWHALGAVALFFTARHYVALGLDGGGTVPVTAVSPSV